jgi:hypothetical protein
MRLTWREYCLVSLIATLVFWGLAFAEGPVARVSWTNPTTYIDGSPLPVTDLKEIIVSWGRNPAGPFTLGTVTVTSPATTVDIPGMVCGNYHFVARAVVKTNEVSTDSTPPVVYATNVSCKTPNPPTAPSVR